MSVLNRLYNRIVRKRIRALRSTPVRPIRSSNSFDYFLTTIEYRAARKFRNEKEDRERSFHSDGGGRRFVRQRERAIKICSTRTGNGNQVKTRLRKRNTRVTRNTYVCNIRDWVNENRGIGAEKKLTTNEKPTYRMVDF